MPGVSGPITKGRFTKLETGEFREFSLNPTSIKDSKGHEYGEFEIPGISDPVIQSGHGTIRKITFKLRLDGDVGYRERRRSNGASDPNAITVGDVTGLPYNVADEIAWYRHFLYTQGNSRLGEIDAQTPTILFTYGPLYQNLRCKMKTAPYEVTRWNPDGSPSRADITITLLQAIESSIDRFDVYNTEVNRLF